MNNSSINNKAQNIPKDYKPTKKIVFCGNSITNYQYLISNNEFIPLLIGDGDIPRIWIYAKTLNNEILTLVDDSVSKVSGIKVDIYSLEKKITIKDIRQGVTILQLEYSNDPIVSKIDLRQLGYNIHGNSSELVVGSNTLSNNTFTNVNTVIGIGK